ncbi:MAG: 2-oxoacid:acceptor oxidoreductase family protein [Clostridia bacterium]
MKITVEEKTRMNMIMLGALCKASGFLPFECLEEIIRETIGRKYPAMLDSNLRGLRRGFEEGTTKAFPNDETYPYVPFTEEAQFGAGIMHRWAASLWQPARRLAMMYRQAGKGLFRCFIRKSASSAACAIQLVGYGLPICQR